MKGQMAIEFLFLTGFAFLFLLVMIAAIANISASKSSQKAYFEMRDLGISVQQELLLASELEDGYIREFNIPDKLQGIEYEVYNGNSSKYNGYIEFRFETQDYTFITPVVVGTIQKGTNYLKKINNTLYIN